MAEALYPKEPPPSYESQFNFSADHRIRMNASPLPSAPPLSHPHPERPRPYDPTTAPPIATPRRTYKKVAIPQHETIPEKTDLSNPKPQPKRVPKRPPPPPPSLNRSTSQPQGNSRKPRPQSSIQLGSYHDTSMPNIRASTYTELDSFGHPRRAVDSASGISTSVYDITDPYSTHQHHHEQDLHHPSPPMQRSEFDNPQRASEFNQPHVYESLPPQLAMPRQVDRPYDSLPVNEPMHPQANFSRQVSAPSPAKRRYHRVSLPPESYASLPAEVPENTAHYAQSALNSHPFTLYDSDPHSPTQSLARPSTFAQPDMQVQSVPQQQVQVVQPFRQTQPQMHRSFSEQSAIGQHPHSMDLAVKPLPKPRSLATPTEQIHPVQPLPLSIQPLPLSGSILPMTSISQQHNTQQFTTTQQLTTFPGQTQVQTYSFAQQSAVVTIPGIMQPPGVQPMTTASPTVVNISPTFPPGQMSVQLVPQEPTTKPLVDRQENSDSDREMATARRRSDGEASSPNLNEDSSVMPGGVLRVQGSPDLNAKPVPKPRKVRKQSSDAELLAGNEPGLEASGSDTQIGGMQDGTGGSDVEAMEQSTGLQLTEPETGTQCEVEAEEHPPPQEDIEAPAPAKPPRRHIRKPPPPPPNGRARQNSVSTAPQPEPAPAAVSVQQVQPEVATVLSQPPATPSGYRIRDIFFNGNIIFLLPLSDPLRLPLRASGRSLRGRGTFKNDCKFEIVYLSSAIGHEQTVLVVMLKCFSRMNHYLAINRKGKIKISKGAAEKCKFVVREVTDRPLLRYGVVTLESAIHPGWFVTVTSSGRTRKCDSSGLPARVDESKFAVRIERIFNPYTSPLVNFERTSVVYQLRDRSVIQLESKTSARFLCVNLKGRLLDTGNKGDVTTHFVVFDRGMGVLSLRSNKVAKMWLRVRQSKIQGHARADLAADFRITEAPDGSVQFESILSPGIYLTFPCEQADRNNPLQERDFIIRNIVK